ncbi:MAG: DNA polymerase I, partial [Treponema sp.]|nr:DNA polymerase I [Treponema sp.]
MDAYGLIYRSYFAFLSRPLRNSSGKNVSALFGFARTLVSLLNSGAPAADSDSQTEDAVMRKPARLAAIFDSRTPTFRHQMYSEYKATRQKTPDDLHEQVPLVEEVLNTLGVPILRVDGFEADDIIATLALKCQAEKRQCYTLSSDKDLLQLVGNGTWELRPSKGGAHHAGAADEKGLHYELVGPKEVKAEWGVSPEKVLDLLSLTGDSSDNVPGVKGVGEKTAVKLMARYGSLDEIYKNIAGIEGAIGKKIAEGKESAYFSKSLIALRTDVPLPVKNVDELSIEKLDRSAAAKVLMREGIRQSAKELDPSVQSEKPARKTESAQGEDEAEAAAPQRDGEMKNSSDPALLGEGEYKTISDIKELPRLLAEAKKQKLLALDFETDSLDAWNARPIGIALAVKPKQAYYVPLAAHRGLTSGDQTPAPFLPPDEVKALLLPFFANPAMT